MEALQVDVMIIENDKFFADTIKLILTEELKVARIISFRNAEEALINIENNAQIIILLDIDLGYNCMTGLEAIEKLKAKAPNCLIMILTIFEEYEKVYEALQRGALGYILKTDTSKKIVDAIIEIQKGGSPMSSSIARKVTDSFKNQFGKIQLLSDREDQIIQLISKGLSEKAVSSELFISTSTVKKHISNIYSKLQVNTRSAALNKYFGQS